MDQQTHSSTLSGPSEESQEEKLMPVQKRLPSNAIAGIEDILALTLQTWPAIRAAAEQARRTADASILGELTTITINVAAIERYARAARRNEYVGDLDRQPARP
jgi:hypothetical protein